MKALEEAQAMAFYGFFASHIVFTLLIDSQAILPSSMIPLPLQQLLAWYADLVRDPLMSNPHQYLWFQSLVVCEMIFQLPFFVVACHFIGSTHLTAYPDWFRSACIAYGAHTATTMVPIFATLLTNPHATGLERFLISLVYFPYLLFPVWILMIAITEQQPTSSREKQKSS